MAALEDIIKRRFRRSSEEGYKISISPRGKLLADFGNYQIGSILDRDYFKESFNEFGQWISEPELEIIGRFEETIQKVSKQSGPRTYSGLPAFSHIDGVAEEAFKTSKISKVPLDFKIIIPLLGHDIVEDHEEIRAKKQLWESASMSSNNDERVRYEQELGGLRDKLLKGYERGLKGYLAGVRGIKLNERKTISRDIEKSIRLIGDLTRFTEKNSYPVSMGHQYGKEGNEDLSQTLRRVFIKNSDRIQVRICYCSFYGNECWVGSNQIGGPQPNSCKEVPEVQLGESRENEK